MLCESTNSNTQPEPSDSQRAINSKIFSIELSILSDIYHAPTTFQLKIKEAFHIQREQPSLNQQLHHVNLKLSF